MNSAKMFHGLLIAKCDSQEFHRHQGRLHPLTGYSPYPSTLLPHTLEKDWGPDHTSFGGGLREERSGCWPRWKNHKPCLDHLLCGTKVITCWGNRRKPVTPRAQTKTHGDGGREETSPLPVMYSGSRALEAFYYWWRGRKRLHNALSKNTR